MEELISIIIPVYNVEKYIEECLNSIIKQTYKNIEIILVDDGSTDRSGIICDQYAKIDKRINVLHKENFGVSNARNTGLRLKKGKYFIFIDSDDWLEPNMIESLYNNLKNNQVDISICNYYINSTKRKTDIQNKKLIKNNLKEMYENLFDENSFGGYLWNKLIKSNIADNLFLDEDIKIEEDVIFLINILKGCNSIYYDPNIILYHYRKRENSAVNFNYAPKDLTKLKSLEIKLDIKQRFQLKNLDKLEFDYVFLLNQAIYIMKKNNIKNDKLKIKIKQMRKAYNNIAFKEANFKQKIKLLFITMLPNLYGAISNKKIEIKKAKE